MSEIDPYAPPASNLGDTIVVDVRAEKEASLRVGSL
jgi:hypothetical protein